MIKGKLPGLDKKPISYKYKAKKTTIHIAGLFNKNGIPGEIRTPDRRLRRPLLYPAELPRHIFFCIS